MADKLLPTIARDTATGPQSSALRKLKDMGDGTFAEVVALGTVAGASQVVVETASGAGATVGAVADAAVTTDANGTLSSKLRGIVKILGDVAASPTANTIGDRLKALLTGIILAAGENHVGQVGGKGDVVSVEKTRPADTTAYTANDAVAATGAGNSWTFPVARVAAGSGFIVGAFFATDDATWVARMELDLYNADIATPLADNAEATRLYVDQSKFLGTIAFPAAAKKTTSSTQAEAANTDVRLGFKCAAGLNIYGVLRLLDAETPNNAGKFRINLIVTQD